MNIPEKQPNLMKIGLYGNTATGKTRFIYAVCESVKEKLSGKARDFHTVKTAELKNYKSYFLTTTETKDGITVEIPSDDSNLGISSKNRPDTCAFEFVDWMGEVVAGEVRSTCVGTTSEKSDLWNRVQDADAFLYIFNPLRKGNRVENVEALLKSELEDLRTFVDEVYRRRENRFLPIVIVVTHDDEIRQQSSEIQNLIQSWRSRAVEVLRMQIQKQSKSYYPPEFAREAHVFFQISLVENPRDTFPILKKLWDLRDIGKKYKKNNQRMWGIVLPLLALLLALGTGVIFVPGSEELPIDVHIRKLSDEKNDPGELHEALVFRTGIDSKDEKKYPPEKVKDLKGLLKSRFDNIQTRLEAKDIAFVEGEFQNITLSEAESMQVQSQCNAFINLKIEAFLSETRAKLASCEQAKTPPLERLKALSAIADRMRTSPWIDTFPDPNGERTDFRTQLDDLSQFLKARIAENGYTVKMSASGTMKPPWEKGVETVLYQINISSVRLDGSNAPLEVPIATLDGNLFFLTPNLDKIINVHFRLKAGDEPVEIFKKEDCNPDEWVATRLCSSGNIGLASLGMPLMGTEDFEIIQKGGKMWKGDELHIKFHKYEVVPSLLLTILQKGESTHE